eukprot:gb/GECG01014222.1/.p1 GENE.gb/GECG01014222.1/~~gb/GECG01014222.1/.p1  ORF type:complete len:1235 (+),score=285.92 gb/GECG01014222.1/:1-3705(+)
MTFRPRITSSLDEMAAGSQIFFEAIRFVLSDQHNNLRAEERQHLLHEGAGSRLMSAFVEIVFDNSDGRIPQDTDEVILRRTVGAKKDEYFVNRKHVTKSDVLNMLESAGFSKANPYYIVEQGKVQKLVNMSDAERLQLLKEVAGTEVYESRRKESIEILAETDGSRDRIQEVIEYIEERLRVLSEERKELAQFQQLDKKQRALKYTLYDKDLTSAKETLETIEIAREEEQLTSSDVQKKVMELRSSIKESEKELQNLRTKEHDLQTERNSLNETLPEQTQKRIEAEVEVQELEEEAESTESSRVELQEELVKRQEEARSCNEELKNQLIPQWEEAEKEYQDIATQLKNEQLKVDWYYNKMGRAHQFSSAEERDTYLQQEIASLEKSISSKKHDLDVAREEKESMEARMNEIRQQLEKNEQEAKQLRDKISECVEEEKKLTARLTSSIEERSRAWRNHSNVDKEYTQVHEARVNAESALQRVIPSTIRHGLREVKKLQEEHGIKGIHGPLIELFEPEDQKFFTAVEVIARNQLWNVVVDDEEVAATCINHLSKKKAGRVTFMPLSQLKAPQVDYPAMKEDCIPLISKLQYEEQYHPAVATIFGKVLLCRDIEIATEYARKANLSCVTLEGDEVQRKGAMYGGFHDPSSSRIVLYREKKDLEEKESQLKEDLDKAKESGTECDQKTSHLRGEQQKCSVEKARAREKLGRINSSHDKLEEQLSNYSKQIEDSSARLRSVEEEVAAKETQLSSLRGELGTPLKDNLTSNEQKALDASKRKVEELQSKQDSASQKVQERRQAKLDKEVYLNEHIARKIRDLRSRLSHEDSGRTDRDTESLLNVARGKLSDAKREEKYSQTRISEIDEQMNEIRKQINDLNDRLSSIQQEESSLSTELSQEARKNEKLLEKRTLAQKKKDDAMKNIRDLGTLPAQELEQYRNMPRKDILSELKKVGKELKKYDNVNRKALDQFSNFSEQRETLLKRKDELDRGAEKIQSLIEHLDHQKDEAIMRTFKGVSRHFREVFSQLVPRGSASIIMKKRDSDNEAADKKNNPYQQIESFCGVAVRASFDEQEESYFIHQLSGGQKALVALAMIFAIQRCDPAPFYLFDEVDQALDATHRSAVANLISRQANAEPDENPAQFITSTFRPEMASVADKFFGVIHQQKISSIVEQSKDEALGFILQIMHEEEDSNRRNSNHQQAEDQVSENLSQISFSGANDESPVQEKRRRVTGSSRK